jgi:biopolymer transport protein ExbD
MLQFEKKKHRHVKEIPLAPVLDLLTVVVFFLVLSSTFEVYKKNILPPAQVSKTESSNIDKDKTDIPVNPKILIVLENGDLNIRLKWFGKKPGVIEKLGVIRSDDQRYNIKLKESIEGLLNQFLAEYPQETAIQLGFSRQVYYQEVLSAYDGVLSKTPDVVLLSFDEVERLYNAG